jgi:hypothetical protein
MQVRLRTKSEGHNANSRAGPEHELVTREVDFTGEKRCGWTLAEETALPEAVSYVALGVHTAPCAGKVMKAAPELARPVPPLVAG